MSKVNLISTTYKPRFIRISGKERELPPKGRILGVEVGDIGLPLPQGVIISKVREENE